MRQPFLRNCQVVFYLDSEAAKGSLVHGATENQNGSKIIAAFVNLEMSLQVKAALKGLDLIENGQFASKRIIDLGELLAGSAQLRAKKKEERTTVFFVSTLTSISLQECRCLFELLVYIHI